MSGRNESMNLETWFERIVSYSMFTQTVILKSKIILIRDSYLTVYMDDNLIKYELPGSEQLK